MQRADVDPDRLVGLLGGRWHARWVERAGSTNADLLADPAGPAPALLVAEEQVVGRGRFDRVWSSPRGAGLTFSVRLRPTSPTAAWGWVPLLAGAALAEAVRGTGVEAVLKWPNDLLAPDGRKLAGILGQGAGGAVVVGIGLNVSTTADELPVPTASSLRLAGPSDVDRTALLAAIAQGVHGWVERLDAAGGDAAACGLTRAYEALCDTLGRDVTVSFAGADPVRGTARAIGADGALVVRDADGRDRPVHAGDVEHVRPA